MTRRILTQELRSKGVYGLAKSTAPQGTAGVGGTLSVELGVWKADY
jgi:hypothetical protein